MIAFQNSLQVVTTMAKKKSLKTRATAAVRAAKSKVVNAEHALVDSVKRGKDATMTAAEHAMAQIAAFSRGFMDEMKKSRAKAAKKAAPKKKAAAKKAVAKKATKKKTAAKKGAKRPAKKSAGKAKPTKRSRR